MTKEYIDNLKKTNYQEYICGNYQIGRYAWILEDVIELPNKIEAKRKLGIWNYYTKEEIMNFMNNISYGYVDRNNNINLETDDDFDKKFSSNYILLTPQEVIKAKISLFNLFRILFLL